MINGSDKYFVASLDYRVGVDAGLFDLEDIMDEKNKPTMTNDSFTYEYEGVFVGSSNSSYYPYELTSGCRLLDRSELKEPKKNTYPYVITHDVAVSNKNNSDNACTNIIKLIPRANGTFYKEVVFTKTMNGVSLREQRDFLRELIHIRFPSTIKLVIDGQSAGEGLLSLLEEPWKTIDDKGNEYICPISSSPLKKLTAETYYDFFKYRDMRLYEILIKASSGFKNKDEQKAYISRICDYIVYALNKYFNSSDWKYIYNVIPTHNLEFIQKCILKVINFFKSWRTQMLDQSVDYIFNDPYQNYVHILDDTLLYSTIDLFDKPSPYDFNETLNHLEFKEKTTPKDYIEFSYYTDQN